MGASLQHGASPAASPGSVVPTTPQELVRWVPAGAELPQISHVKVHSFSGDRWDNVKVCRKLTRGPFVMPRGHVASDLVALVLTAPDRETGNFGAATITDRGRPGTVNLLPAGMPYTYRCEGPREILHVSITEHVMDWEDGPECAVELRPLFACADPLVAQLALALLDETTAGSGGGRLYGETLGASLSLHLARRYGARPLQVRGQPDRIPRQRLGRVLEYIETNLGQDLKLKDLARLAGMSRTRFLEDFRRSTGRSPHQYVMERRIERAKTLLANRDLSILEVALSSGYADQTSFTRVFRRVTRMTPRGYRNASVS